MNAINHGSERAHISHILKIAYIAKSVESDVLLKGKKCMKIRREELHVDAIENYLDKDEKPTKARVHR